MMSYCPPAEAGLESSAAAGDTVTRWRTLRIMPRVSGVSFSSTLWPMRRSPMLCTTFACFLSKPMVLLTSVILTRP